MALGKQQIRDLYAQNAEYYDLSTKLLFRLAGFNIERYRRLAVQALGLKPGDTVVDMGCGTGINFPYLEEAIGDEGRIMGVDLTDAMLAQASARAQASGWRNVELVQADLAHYPFPRDISSVISTLAITLVPEFDDVICRAASALVPGGRLAIFDLKKPDRWPMWLVRFGAWLNKPYGVHLDLADRHPWKSVDRYLQEVRFSEFYFGAAYLSVGRAST